ncbi:DinB family protein [Mucilaginibacter sp. BT774]|uniref:DinB family protein n=1 Tax=Mucilaginibacter sp. BT774 TaxID=3062276 RepID=UPI0026772C96|nr:DinB family protein [Mucilaginibacter sp. BT774]MDO3624601.1 DinB family protein [Mucilaginibacter sp. BT774]
MTTIESLLKEMHQEAETTRKMLSRIPDDKYDWQPHEKSMTIRRLATHLADIPSWLEITIDDDGLNFATTTHKEPVINNTAELLQFLDESVRKGGEALSKANEELLKQEWTLANGDQVLSVRPKSEVIRMAYCQIVHHRAQLGVYLRLLNVPIPGSYGPSADEMNF